ncbi:MAG: RNA methyltransferase [Clostridia bacterium]|nr:RNA methyltransferase [Clostridia bacterium]
MLYRISSSKNDKYKFFKSLKTKKYRTDSNSYTVEGKKSVVDAINSDERILSVIVSEDFYENNEFSYPDNTDIYIVGNEIFSNLSSTENPQGIIAVLSQSDNIELALDKEKAYIYCDHIQDPGNLGTIIRTADAAGFGGVLLSKDCVDLYNPKTVRSSMGSFFHIKKLSDFTAEALSEYKKQGFSIVCGVLSDRTIEYTKADFSKPVIIVIGNEANGISNEILAISDVNIKIPIDGNAESLNAAVAAAIIMYEVRRQRK